MKKLLLFLMNILLMGTVAWSQDTVSIDKGYPVSTYFDTLFYIKNRLGPLSARERAELAHTKNKVFTRRPHHPPDSIRVDTSNGAADIVYKDMVLVTVSQADADSLQSGRFDLAQFYRQEIIRSLKEYRSETNIVEITKRVGFVLLTILALSILILYVNRYFNAFKEWLSEKMEGKLAGLTFRNYEFLTREAEHLFLRRVINVTKYFVIVLSIYLPLPFVFRLFPWTKAWSDKLIGFVLDPLKTIVHAIINFIPNLISIIVIYMVFRYIIKGIRFLAGEIAASKLKIAGFYPDWAKPTYNIVRFVLYAFMIVVIWPFLPGSNSPVFQGVSVFIGLLFSFGSSSAISNVVAGMVITYMRPFRLKDRVKIGDTIGDVVEKTLLVTRVKTNKNEIITIPNSAVLSGNTINYSSLAAKDGCILYSTVTIGYDVPWRQVHELLIAAALNTEGIDTNKKPFVLQTSLEDWYVSYQINAYTRQPQKTALIYSSLHQHIQDKFNEAGVEIMSPHYQGLRDGNQSTIPADYLPENDVVPGFVLKKEETSKKQKTNRDENSV